MAYFKYRKNVTYFNIKRKTNMYGKDLSYHWYGPYAFYMSTTKRYQVMF